MDSYKVTIDTWDKIAALYEEQFMDVDLYDDTYASFCQLVQKPDARILEIGCGPGNITRYLLSKRPDFKILATDVAPNMVALSQKNNPAADCTVMDGRSIGSLELQFDAIVCGFCMPYLAQEDASQLIRNCAALLHENGILYFSTIEGDYSQSGYETGSSGELKAYVYYYEENVLTEMLLRSGFELLNLNRKPYTKTDGTLSYHLIFIAGKK